MGRGASPHRGTWVIIGVVLSLFLALSFAGGVPNPDDSPNVSVRGNANRVIVDMQNLGMPGGNWLPYQVGDRALAPVRPINERLLGVIPANGLQISLPHLGARAGVGIGMRATGLGYEVAVSDGSVQVSVQLKARELRWDFGDGSVGQTPVFGVGSGEVTHVYHRAGTYRVKLTTFFTGTYQSARGNGQVRGNLFTVQSSPSFTVHPNEAVLIDSPG